MMHEQDSENGQGFKFVDRRRVDEEGHLRDMESKTDETKSASSSPIEPPSSQAAHSAITFSLFVQSFAHQAMMALGMVAWPDSGLIKTDLNVAKQMIDILLLLKEKTAKNLDASEQALIETLSYQLQMAFIEISQTPKTTK